MTNIVIGGLNIRIEKVVIQYGHFIKGKKVTMWDNEVVSAVIQGTSTLVESY